MFVSRTAGRHASPHTTRRIRTYSKFGGIAVTAAGTAVALTAGVIATAAPASATSKTVSLTVDGVTSSVSTNAASVSQLLAEESVPFDATDIVSPGLKADLYNGMAVSWTPAVRVVVKRANDVQAYRVVGSTVGEVRDELALPSAPTAKYSEFETRRYKITKFYTENGRKLSAGDPVHEDTRAVVRSVRIAFPDGKLRIKPTVVKDRSPLVRKGSTRLFSKGHYGSRAVVYRKVFVDGKLQERKIVQSEVLRKPGRSVVRVGTGPNWIGLANCESGGNPNAVNPAGYYGLYQFSLSTWRAVGGRGYPTDYGYWEQTKRAWKLYQHSGRSPWPVCGAYL